MFSICELLVFMHIKINFFKWLPTLNKLHKFLFLKNIFFANLYHHSYNRTRQMLKIFVKLLPTTKRNDVMCKKNLDLVGLVAWQVSVKIRRNPIHQQTWVQNLNYINLQKVKIKQIHQRKDNNKKKYLFQIY